MLRLAHAPSVHRIARLSKYSNAQILVSSYCGVGMRLVWGVEWKEMRKVAIFRKGAIRKFHRPYELILLQATNMKSYMSSSAAK